MLSTVKRIEKGIYERGPHQYQVKVRRNGASITSTFETLTAARAFKQVQTGKVVAREYVDTKVERRTTLRSLLERYLSEITPHKKGWSSETYRINAWMRSPLASYSVAGIEPKDIADWISARKAEGKAPTTISNNVNLLSAVFKKGREWGLKIDNPCTGVSRPIARPARFAVMTEPEKALLIKACERGPVWLPFVVRIALTTCMRQGEIRRLNWNYIYETHAYLPETKNGDTRDVPLTMAAMAVIEELREALPRRLDGWVFGHPDLFADEGGFTSWQVQQAYRRASAYAKKNFGVPRCTFHDLRHVATTDIWEIHSDVIDLQKTTGHKTLAVLSKYINETPEVRTRKLREREAARSARGAA